MDRGLIVVEETPAHADLLREAEEHARGADASLTILTFATERDVGEGVEKFEALGGVEGVTYDDEDAFIEAAEDALADYVAQTLGDTDVSYDVVVEVIDGGYGTATLAAADEYDADHLFVTGRRRSPTGKAIFGDWVQRVLLGFDEFVTVQTREDAE
ncbi:nucleotide-binding universal stress UspA family protein [Halarchaeum rubridurum]|uniref:Nucleotide-binding universal stress UspA family protein n=1 Tax=Halarchaeum rubridurum TaxID=489911 RepID=A0A830FZ06_9EURY|nr:universal stress protein [Halarchaeum rubridurum]MBP1954721.1 nucleotide-binding universal stress UspA family protein [Halarchaeum rubridurum]GGM63331.1 universal stress protein UspA [Halarchaeum rubridurum]